MASLSVGKLDTDCRGATSSKLLSRQGTPRSHVLWPVLLVATVPPTTACAERVTLETASVSDLEGEQDARAEHDVPKPDAIRDELEGGAGADSSPSPFVGDAPEFTAPGQPSTADCDQPETAYRVISSERCLGTRFNCEADEAAFADACGCGCVVPRFFDSSPARVPIEAGPLVDLPEECNGPSGMLAWFTHQVRRLSMARDEVYVLVGSAEEEATWRVSKRNGSVSLLTTGAAAALFQDEPDALVVTDGGAVAKGQGVGDGGDGFTYSTDGAWLVRDSAAGGAPEALFSVDGLFTFIAFDAAFFGVAQSGVLFHSALAPNSGEPAPVEQRGAFDDDDYAEVLGLDEDAVYWLAGVDPALRTSDGDPLALFRTCRSLY